MDRDRMLSPRAVDAMIAEGATVVFFGEYVLRLDAWLARHPGGSLAVLHMVGRDATDEMTAYHSAATLRAVKAHRIGRKPPGPWTNRTPPIRGGVFGSAAAPGPGPGDPPRDPPAAVLRRAVDRGLRDYPPPDPAVQQAIVARYRALHRRVVDEGLFHCRYREYAKDAARCLGLFAAFLVALGRGWLVASAVLLGLFWHQIMFVAHDAGHGAISHVFAVDALIGLVVADLCCGLSIGWWKSSHNVHHLVTNQPQHDPDIQNLPLFATCPSFFRSLTSTYYPGFVMAWDAAAARLVPWQKYTYFPVMALARFNLYLLSWRHVLSPTSPSLARSAAWWIRPAEVAMMAAYWFLFGYCLLWRSLPSWSARLVFALVSHVATMPLHLQINLSHWGMSTADLGESESFAQRQLRTTMDVDCPPWLDFVHGGLQFQAVHHLFPRAPRHNLRRIRALVEDFCRDTGIPYSIMGFADGNRKVLGRLHDVTDQLRILVECQRSMADKGGCHLY